MDAKAKKQFASKLKEYVKMEDELSEFYLHKSLEVKDEVSRLVFRQIALDCTEHSDILETAIKMLTSSHGKYDPTVIAREIQEHKKAEIELVKFYKKALDTIDDEDVKILFQKLIADETRHHAMLETTTANLKNPAA